LLKKLNQENGLTIILVSHEIDVIAKEVNKVACINKNLVYHGQPQKLLEGNLIEKLYGKSQRLIAHQH
jgi:zinc transport system ATP-binding protein